MLLTQLAPPLTLQPICYSFVIVENQPYSYIAFLLWHPLPHYISTCFIYQADWFLLIRCFMNQISAWCSQSICSYMRVFTVLLFQKTDGSTQTSRRYHWGDGYQPNRFKPAHKSIQNKPVCCFVKTKICIQNVQNVLRHCLFGKGIN